MIFSQISRRFLPALALTSPLLLGACSTNNDLPVTPETATTITNDFEQAVLDTVHHTGIEEHNWYYAGGKIFSTEYFHGRAPYMGQYCADSDDGTMLFTKSILLEAPHPFKPQEYKAKIQDMKTHWESQGHEPYTVGSDNQSQKIAYRTPNNTLIQYYAGETGLMILAETPCILPAPSPSPTPTW